MFSRQTKGMTHKSAYPIVLLYEKTLGTCKITRREYFVIRPQIRSFVLHFNETNVIYSWKLLTVQDANSLTNEAMLSGNCTLRWQGFSYSIFF